MQRPPVDIPVLARAIALCSALAACTSAPVSTHGAEDLLLGSQLAARYMHAAYDPARVRATCKVWHELYAPDGRVITKGLGGEFEHHRGLFFGFNQTKVEAKSFDFWHCNKGEAQRHMAFASPSQLGVDDSWQVAQIDWTSPDGAAVLHELRGLSAKTIDARTWRFDFVSELRCDRAVSLSGDPQHSGCQFRALAQFAEKAGPKVRYVRPAGVIAHDNDVWTHCDWIAAILPLEGEPVTVLRVELPGNPSGAQWSTRDYGRFGATFSHTLQPNMPLRVAYSYVVALGALDENRCARLADAILSAGPTGT